MSLTSDPMVEVLLVEDNSDDVELAMHALQKHRLCNHIQVLRDGAEALEFLFCSGAWAHRRIENAPKLVLLDVQLPKIDGLEVLRRMKSNPHTQNLPVVMLTSSRQEQDIVECYRLGANSYIVKPVDFKQFSQAVREVGLYWLLLNQHPAA